MSSGFPPARLCHNCLISYFHRRHAGLDPVSRKTNMLQFFWIPDQVRNDKKMSMQSSDNCDTLCCAGMTKGNYRIYILTVFSHVL